MNPRTSAAFVAPPLVIVAIAATYSSSSTLVWVGRSMLLVSVVIAVWLGLKAFRAARVAQNSPAPFPLLSLTQRGLAWSLGGSNSKSAAVFLLILGVLPLSLYPVVFLFGFFGVLGVAGSGSFIDMVALGIVLFPAVTYPLVYLLFAVLTFRRLRRNEPAVRIGLIPVIYVAVASVLIALARVVG